MTPEDMIAELDSALAEAGEDITLRRTTGTSLIPFDITCRCALRGYDESDLVGDIKQQDQKFILSPTEINRWQWPGPGLVTDGETPDRRVPRKNDVILTTRGKLSVQAASGIYIQGVLVRIDGRVRGS